MKLLITKGLTPNFEKMRMEKKDIIITDNIITDVIEQNCDINMQNNSSANNKNNNYFDRVIIAENKIVSPGFVDVHSHSDLAIFDNEKIKAKYYQGITSEIVGNCGLSVCPVKENNKSDWKNFYSSIWGCDNVDWSWTDTASFLNQARKETKIFIETFVGYSTLRYYISNFKNIKYDNKLLKKMEILIEKELSNGAKGISLGIPYSPNIFADENEYFLITKLLKRHNKILNVHLRDEGNNIIESIEEIMKYIKINNCKLHISHLKTYGEQNWYKNKKILELIDTYINQGFDITFDAYPYDAGSTTLNALLPPYYHERSLNELFDLLKKKNEILNIEKTIEKGLTGWENYAGTIGFDKIFPIGLKSDKYKNFTGKSIEDISNLNNKSSAEIICDIIITEKGKTSMLLKAMKFNNIIDIFKHPKFMAGSDGLFSEFPHPRTYGTFPRIIKKFCYEEKIFDLITILYKTVKFPAERFQLKKRGDIKIGNIADLIMFDINKVKDNATFDNPTQQSEGIDRILLGNSDFKNFYRKLRK